MTEMSPAAHETGELKTGEEDTYTNPHSGDLNFLKKNWFAIGSIIAGLVGSGWMVVSAWGALTSSVGIIEERTKNTQKDVGDLKIGIVDNRSSIEESKETLTEKLHDVDKRLSIIEDRLSGISDEAHKPNQAGFSVPH